MRRLREAIRLKKPELCAKTNLGFSPKIRRISFRNHRIPVFGFVWLLTIAKTQETTPDNAFLVDWGVKKIEEGAGGSIGKGLSDMFRGIEKKLTTDLEK